MIERWPDKNVEVLIRVQVIDCCCVGNWSNIPGLSDILKKR